MKLHESIKLIEGYFNFALVHNYGAAFGILQHYTKFILVVAFFSLFLLLYFSKHFLNNDNKLLQIASGLLFGGALGNIIDRFVNGYVVDFIQVGYKNHYWPVFNLADTFVNIGVFLFIYDLFLKNFFLIFLKYLNLFGKKKNIEN
jgi:signal peptidase II